MDAEIIVRRLRAFLLGLSGLLCLGTALELWLVEHTQSALQLLPFVLCAAGLAAAAAALLRPSQATLLALRVVMALLVGGSLLGGYEHLAGNVAFELEIRPGATLAAVWLDALRGASPLLAPGILPLAALLALAATYAHPALAPARPVRSVKIGS